jgi:hypothetical protein
MIERIAFAALLAIATNAHALVLCRTPDGHQYVGDKPPAGCVVSQTLAEAPAPAPDAVQRRVFDEADRTRAELAEDGRRITAERQKQRAEERRQEADDEARKKHEYERDPIVFARCMAVNTPSAARGVCY